MLRNLIADRLMYLVILESMENVPKYTSISLQHVCDETHSPHFDDHLLVAVERYGWRSPDVMARQNSERCHDEGVKPV